MWDGFMYWYGVPNITMSGPMTVHDLAHELGIEAETVMRWCRQGSIEYARTTEGKPVVPQSEFERLTEGLDPANDPTDRVELYVRVNNHEVESLGPAIRFNPVIEHAHCEVSFSRPPAGADEEESIVDYLGHYETILKSLMAGLEANALADPFDRIESDIYGLFSPYTTTPEDHEGFMTVLTALEELLDGNQIDPAVVLETTIIEPGEHRGAFRKTDPAKLETTVAAKEISDSEAVAIPATADAGLSSVQTMWLDTWHSAVGSLCSGLPKGGTVMMAFLPTASRQDRFELRTVVQASGQ